MIPGLYIPTYTIKDWRLWEGDWELINGAPVALSPSPVIKHQMMAAELFIYLKAGLTKNKSLCNTEALYLQDWLIDVVNVVRPDISIVYGNLDPEGHITKAPVLIVEIFSASSRLKDRNTKFNLYEFCGVKYYLMADPDNRSAEIYELIDNKYKQMFAPFHFSITENCAIEFNLKSAIEY